MFSCVFVIFTYGVLGQMWYMYLIVSIPDFCVLPCSTYCPRDGRADRLGLSEPEFFGNLMYKIIVSTNNLSAQFIRIISHNKKDWL